MPEFETLNKLIKEDDVTNNYLETRAHEDRVTSPMGQLLNDTPEEEKEPVADSREPGFIGSMFEKVFGSTDDKKGVDDKPFGIPREDEAQLTMEEFNALPSAERMKVEQRWFDETFDTARRQSGGLADPLIDPISAGVGGGVGGFLLSPAKTLTQKLITGALSGGIAATAEFPIGAAGEVVGEKIPGADLPFTVAAGLLSGVTLERVAEKAARKAMSKISGKIPSPRKVKKAASDAINNLRKGEPADDIGEAVSEAVTKESEAVKKVTAEQALEQRQEDALNAIIGDESKPLVEIIPQEKGERFLNIEPDIGERSVNINLARVNTTDDIKEVISKTAKTFEPSIQTARREVQNNEETAKLAEDLNLHPADLLARRQGQAFNAEEALAARNVLASSAERLQELALAIKSPNAGKLEMVAFRKALTLHKAIQEQVSGATAEAGRALQSFRIPSASTKVKLSQIDDLITAMGDDGRFTEQMADALLTLDDPRAINEFTKKAYRATSTDVIMELWINGLLSGPQTQAVNMLSNSLVAAWQVPERILAAGFSTALRSGKDSVRFGEGLTQAFGLIQGMKDGLKAFGKAVKTEAPEDIVGKLELPYNRAISADGLGLSGMAGRSADYLGRAVRLPGTLLTAGDSFFKSVGHRMELNARAYRQAVSEGLKGGDLAKRTQQIISDPPEDIKLAYIDAARYQTFTNELTGIAKDYQTAVAKYPALKIITPFVRTPTNIVKFFAERSPLAPLAKSFRDDISAGGSRRDLALARMSLGSSVMAISAMMAAEGKITGGGPVDTNIKSLYYDTGWQPYSIKIGDKYVSYSRFEPLGTLLGVAADFSEISGELNNNDADKLVAHMAMAVANNLTSKTFLRGISEAIQVLDDPVRHGDRFVQNFLGTIIPTGVSQVARTQDPVLREVRSVADKIISRVPGYSKKLPPRRNLWGEEILLSGGLGPDIISPIYASDMEENPVSMEMIRNNVSVSKPTRQIMGIELTPEEYDFYVKESGQKAKKILEKEIKTSNYLRQSDGTDGGKSIMLRSIILATRQDAQFKTIQAFPDLKIEIDKRNTERGKLLQPTQPTASKTSGVRITQ